MSSTLDLPDILQATCRAAVDLLGVSHSGAVLFEADSRSGSVEAEYPPLGTRGLPIRLEGALSEERLVTLKEPIQVEDLSNPEAEAQLGEVLHTLRRFDIRSILIVPVVSKDRVIGSFSLDSIGATRRFTAEDLELSQTFAAVVAMAIDNARLYAQVDRRVRELEMLRAATLDATASPDLDALGDVAVSRAVKLLAARKGGLYVRKADCSGLLLRYQSSPSALTGTWLGTGEGMAGRIAGGGPPYMIVPDYGAWAGRAAAFDTGESPFEAVLSASVRCGNELFGVLWVEDKQGRVFAEADAQLLCAYGEHIAVAMRTLQLQERLALVTRANQEVIAGHGLQDGLQRLAAMVVRDLQHSFCRILLLDGTRQHLMSTAAYPILRRTGFAWEPRIGSAMALATWPAFAAAVHSESPAVLTPEDPADARTLARLSRELQLDTPLQSLLLMPLRFGGSCIGILDVGELRTEVRSYFGPESITLVQTVAASSSAIIDRFRDEESNDRRRRLLTRLDETTRHLRGEKEASKLIREIPRLAAQMLDYDRGELYLVRATAVEREEVWPHSVRQTDAAAALFRQVAVQAAKCGDAYSLLADDPAAALADRTVCEILGVPFKEAGRVTRVLVVATTAPLVVCDTNKEILERFAAVGARALELARVIDSEQRIALHLKILHRISDYIQSARDLDTIFHVVLTGMTAGYGLGFNRAALFLRETADGRDDLVGRMGIGFVEEQEQRDNWQAHEDSGLEDFGRYLDALEHNALESTPVGLSIQQLRIAIDQGGAMADCIRSGRPLWSAEATNLELLEPFTSAFQPSGPIALVPLVARGRTLGVIVVDNRFTRAPITPDDEEALLTYANTAVIAIDNVALLGQKEQAKRKLEDVLAAAALAVKVAVLGGGQTGLQSIVEATRGALACDAVVLFTYDHGRAALRHPPCMTGVRDVFKAAAEGKVSADSVVYQIMKRDSPYVVESVAQDPVFAGRRFARDESIVSCIALPLRVGGDDVGVMFVNYRQAKEFSTDEQLRASQFGNHAAVAIRIAQLQDTSRRLARHLDAVNVAATSVATSTTPGPGEWLATLLKCTVEAVVNHEPDRKGFATLHVLDAARGRLQTLGTFPQERLPSVSRALGHDGILEPSVGRRSGVTMRVLRTGVAEIVPDVRADADYIQSDPLVRSEIAAPLKVRMATIGVLNVESYSLDAFDKSDLRVIEDLAGLASLALGTSRSRAGEQNGAF